MIIAMFEVKDPVKFIRVLGVLVVVFSISLILLIRNNSNNNQSDSVFPGYEYRYDQQTNKYYVTVPLGTSEDSIKNNKNISKDDIIFESPTITIGKPKSDVEEDDRLLKELQEKGLQQEQGGDDDLVNPNTPVGRGDGSEGFGPNP